MQSTCNALQQSPNLLGVHQVNRTMFMLHDGDGVDDDNNGEHDMT
jgi:hypothetical protein